MDQVDRYFELLELLSDAALKASVGATEVVEQKLASTSELVREALEIRQKLIDASDLERVRGYMEIGHFRQYKNGLRIAAWALALELEEEICILELKRSCAPYEQSLPLFQVIPECWTLRRKHGERAPELLDETSLSWEEGGQLARFGSNLARLSTYVSPQLVSWARETYPDIKRYVRLEPFEAGPNLLSFLNEDTIRPINPKWWNNLSLWPGERDSAVYTLSDRDFKEDLLQSWEFRVKKMGRLELSFRRDNQNVLSGMIEEIPRFEGQRILIGRCLHFTSAASVESEIDAAIAGHLDGAINIYIDGDASKRWDGTLEDGKVCDASFRTHVFRFDDIPLRALLKIAPLFLRSSCLVAEWFQDQFGRTGDLTAEAIESVQENS